MGTFPKRSKDHIKADFTLRRGGRDHYLLRFALTADQGDQLLCGAASGLGIAGIDGDNFWMQELGQRGVADAR